MRTYTCLVTDNRYSVPTLSFYLATDEERARELARRDLEANPHHSAFEVRDGDRLLFVERREALGL
ncbi:hypothetical protein [Phenylobacterium sp.]|uniref:hypothetical protein n=1 Tax=Phenylobacterium sp. TaxID=1871053 RepID=UPI0028127CF8|nr:hypothetical protein [Phenylobacterium sp.]